MLLNIVTLTKNAYEKNYLTYHADCTVQWIRICTAVYRIQVHRPHSSDCHPQGSEGCCRRTGDTTELPWSQNYSSWDNAHSVYFYDDAAVFEGWAKVGVQSIYYGGDEVRKSAISWIETPFYTGIDNITTGQTTGKAIYNISGQRIVAPAKGLNIINGQKVMIK